MKKMIRASADAKQSKRLRIQSSIGVSNTEYIKVLHAGDVGYDNLQLLADTLNRQSGAADTYFVDTTYFDHGLDWQWTTLLRRGGISRSTQMLNPRQQERVVIDGDIQSVADEILSKQGSVVNSSNVIASDDGYTYPVAQWQDNDTIVQYRGFTSISWHESDEDCGWCIQDNNGKNIDLAAAGIIDQGGNSQYDSFDESSIKEAIDELIANGYRLEDDFDMGRDHYGEPEILYTPPDQYGNVADSGGPVTL